MNSRFGPSPAAVPPRGQLLLVSICLALYLLFCLQQIVLPFRFFGMVLSLGSVTMLGCMLAISAGSLVRHGVPSELRRPLLAILMCIAALSASVLASNHIGLACAFAVRYATSLLALWAMLNLAAACPRWPRAATLAALIAVWFNLALAGAVWFQWPEALRVALAFHPEETFKYLPRISGMYEHPALLATSAAMVLLLVLRLQQRGEVGRISLALALVGAVLALALTQVRNTLLPVGVLMAWWAWPRSCTSNRQRHIARVALGGIAVLAVFVLWLRYPDMTSAAQENMMTAFTLGRTYLWSGALDAWRDHPWFGLGAGVFQFMVPDYTGGRFHRGELHAHNLLLAALSETGLFGLLAGLALIFALWRPLLRIAAERQWAIAWLILVLGLSTFDFYFPFFPFSMHAALAVASLHAGQCAPSQADGVSRSTT